MRLRYYLLIILGSLFAQCTKSEDYTVAAADRELRDLANYSTEGFTPDTFCQFELIENIRGCWLRDVQVYRDCHYDLLFTRYNNGLTGADATYSMPLPDGRIMWMFGDTFLGTVKADRTREGAPFIRNSIVIQDEDELVTYYQNTSGSPSSYISPSDPDEWYWPLDATMHGGEIQMMLGRLEQIQANGAFSFAYVGFDLVTIDPADITIISQQNKIADPDISYGSCILEDGDYTYIYGISSRPFQKRAHVARVQGGDLKDTWEYYNGQSWTDNPSSHIIAQNVSDQFSIFKDGEIYYAVTHEIIFGNKIFIAQSTSPTGPFTNNRTLYCTPETGGDIFTYNSFVHPELSENGELRISYNINSFDFTDLFSDVDLYRPRFIRVDNWR